jgi:CheY-like chemotaxis protein
MPLIKPHKLWSRRWLITGVMWLLWLVVAQGLTANPILYLTPLLAIFTHFLLSPHSTDQAVVSPASQQPQLTSRNITTDSSILDIKHDLLTPTRLIISFCDVLTKANLREESASFLTENISAIRRNAQKLEELIVSLTLPATNPVQQTNYLELEPVLNEALTLTADLMTSRNISVELKIIPPLPPLILNRTYLLQAILNVLRGIAQSNEQPLTTDSLQIFVRVYELMVQIKFVSSPSKIQHTVENPSWMLTEQLVEKLSGQLVLETASNSESTIIIALRLDNYASEQLPDMPIQSRTYKESIIVIADQKPIADLFKRLDATYNFIVVSSVEGLITEMLHTPNQILGVVLTRHTDIKDDSIHAQIANLVRSQIPIIEYVVPSPDQQLNSLNATYLAKPIDYEALMNAMSQFDLTGQRILIVDDNADTTTMLARMLSSMPAKYDTRTAHTAHAASNILDISDHNIGAAIVDVSLPDMDGLQWVDRLRADERFLQLPIVLMSAHPTLDFMMYSHITRRISIYLDKGFDVDMLPENIERVLNAFGPPTV